MKKRKPILFIPGPVMVSDRVKSSLNRYVICHRGQEFMDLFIDTEKKIRELFKADYTYQSLLISGSGTSSNEAVLSSIFKKDEAVLLISNGVFGERLEEIIDKYKIKKYVARFDWCQPVDTSIVESLLKEHPEITTVAMVYHETSTGMINKVKEVGIIAKKMKVTYFVDAISAAAGEYIDIIDQNIDIITSVSGKAIGAYPGVAYICAKKSLLENIKFDDCKNIYLNLYKHYHMAIKKAQTPNTPNVTLIYALNEALTEYLENPQEKLERYKQCSLIIRKGIKDLGIKLLLPEDQQSNTVTSILLPEKISILEFVNKLENEKGYVVYLGKGPLLEKNMLQIATMGEIYPEDCKLFLQAFKELLIEFQNSKSIGLGPMGDEK